MGHDGPVGDGYLRTSGEPTMIEAVTLEDFRLFRRLDLQGLTRVTVIGGRNNSPGVCS